MPSAYSISDFYRLYKQESLFASIKQDTGIVQDHSLSAESYTKECELIHLSFTSYSKDEQFCSVESPLSAGKPAVSRPHHPGGERSESL